MKKIIYLFSTLITVVFYLNTFNCAAQTPNWIWAKSAGAESDDEAYSVAVDATGNSYIAGYFNSSVMIMGSTTLTNMGGDDVFLAKCNASGNVVWAKSGMGPGYDMATSVAVDTAGNVYITGFFTSDTLQFGTFKLINAGGTDNTNDIFIVKYNSAGTVLWAKSYGGLSDDGASSIAVNKAGNLFVTGYFDSYHINFGTIALVNTDTNNYSDDIFLAKYDVNGTVLWAKRIGGYGSDEGNAVAVDTLGNVYLAAIFDSPTITIGTTTLTNADNMGSTKDLFIAKYNSFGSVLWAKGAGGADYDYALSVAVTAAGDAYLTGYFASLTLAFGSTILTNADSLNYTNDIFIAKYNSTGSVQWAKSIGGQGNDVANSVALNAMGNPYLSGYFTSPAILFGTTNLINDDTNYYRDIFLAKFDPNGNAIWAKRAGGSSDDQANSVAANAAGDVLVTGSFHSPTIAFDGSILTNADNTTDSRDIFLAKLVSLAGIKELNETSDFLIFPNPATENISLVMAGKSTIEILNSEGQVIKILKTEDNTTTVDVSGLSRGMYFVKIITEKGIGVKKFVKE